MRDNERFEQAVEEATASFRGAPHQAVTRFGGVPE
jgi:hypothetical protein